MSSLRWFGTAKKETVKATTGVATPLEASTLPDPREFAQEKAFWPTQEPLKQKRLQAKEKGEAWLSSFTAPLLSLHTMVMVTLTPVMCAAALCVPGGSRRCREEGPPVAPEQDGPRSHLPSLPRLPS